MSVRLSSRLVRPVMPATVVVRFGGQRRSLSMLATVTTKLRTPIAAAVGSILLLLCIDLSVDCALILGSFVSRNVASTTAAANTNSNATAATAAATKMVGSVIGSGAAAATGSSAPVPVRGGAAPNIFTKQRKQRVVVLGCGWGGFSFLSNIDREKFDVVCVSPRNYFLFTPLLASTTVGTLEFRAIIEPVRTLAHLTYYQSFCENIDTANRTIRCREVYSGKSTFDVPFDQLVIAAGMKSNTFGIPGVEEHAFFLKDLANARAIRNRILECFERASCQGVTSYAERAALSRFVVVGGGPTSIEFASELYDFVVQDVKKWFPDLHLEIILVCIPSPLAYASFAMTAALLCQIESSDHILGSFDDNLSRTAMKTFKKRKIQVLTNTRVKEVRAGEVVLGDGSVIQTGLVVWSTGLSPQPLNQMVPWAKEARSGRIYVDEYLQAHVSVPGVEVSPPVPGSKPAAATIGPVVEGVYAIGDCAVPILKQLPATAQVASQEGIYLAKEFNKRVASGSAPAARVPSPFVYQHRGMLAYIGNYRALADLGSVRGSGIGAWLFWRSAYFTQLMSWKNKILVPMHWFKQFLFGRDISRF